jgi:hypothetical protein
MKTYGRVSSSVPQSLYPWRKNSRHPLHKKLVEPQKLTLLRIRRKKNLLLPEIEPEAIYVY